MNFFQSDVSIINALGYSVLGMSIVFMVLIMLIVVVKIMEIAAKRLNKEEAAEAAPVQSNPAAVPAPVPVKYAPGTACELKLYNVEERDAAMVMAIVADKLGKPLNELRFISIREVTE